MTLPPVDNREEEPVDCIICDDDDQDNCANKRRKEDAKKGK